MGRIEMIKFLANEALPKLAKERGWPVTENHCFLRIAYDNLFGKCWYEVLSKKRAVLKQLDSDQMDKVIEILKSIPDNLEELNKKSLRFRRTYRRYNR